MSVHHSQSPAPKKYSPGEEASVMMSIALVWQIGFFTAVPVLVLGLGGAFLDKEFETSPMFLLLGFLLSFVVSAVVIFQHVRRIIRVEFADDKRPHHTS